MQSVENRRSYLNKDKVDRIGAWKTTTGSSYNLNTPCKLFHLIGYAGLHRDNRGLYTGVSRSTLGYAGVYGNAGLHRAIHRCVWDMQVYTGL